MQALQRRAQNASVKFSQDEGDETLELLLEHWNEFSEDTKLEIKWLAWRGSAGHHEYVPKTNGNGNGRYQEPEDGHVYLSDGSIPDEQEFLITLKKFRP